MSHISSSVNYQKNNGEHYVALGQDLTNVVIVITWSPQMRLQTESKIYVTPLTRVQSTESPRSSFPAMVSSPVQASEDMTENLFDLPVEILPVIFTMVVNNNLKHTKTQIYQMFLDIQELLGFVLAYVTRPVPSLLSLPIHCSTVSFWRYNHFLYVKEIGWGKLFDLKWVEYLTILLHHTVKQESISSVHINKGELRREGGGGTRHNEISSVKKETGGLLIRNSQNRNLIAYSLSE